MSFPFQTMMMNRTSLNRGVTPTFEDDFSSYADQAAADLVWPNNSGDAHGEVNFTNEEIDFQDNVDTHVGRLVHDMTTIDNTSWTLDIKYVIDTFAAYTSGSQTPYGGIGCWDSDESVAVGSSSDFIGMIVIANGSDYRTAECDGEPTLNGTQTTFTHVLQAETTYPRIQRVSAISAKVELFSDADRTSSVESNTVVTAATVTSLQYIGIKYNGLSGTTGEIAGNVDDLKFYDATVL